jgi:hypothetical protein
MMQPYQPGWPPMAGPRPAPRRNLRRAAIVALSVLVVCWLAGLTRTPAGWAAIALTFVVVGLVNGRPRRGRALVEYGIVALLVVLVMANAGHARIPRPAPPTSQSVEELRQSVIDGWQSFATGFTTPPAERNAGP